MEPSECDPATIDLFRKKFFGDKKPKTKLEKQKKSKKANKLDALEEDESALLKNRKEADIHIDTRTKKKKSGDKGVTVENNQLDFGDIFNQLEQNTQASSDLINTTKLKKQLKNMKRDGSKQLSAPLSGYKKVKIMRE